MRQDLGYRKVLIEKFYCGEDHRIYVIDNMVIGAIKRIPANVIGNGTNTIKQLINRKNKARKNNPYFAKRLIKIDREVIDYVYRAGYILDSVPQDGELIYLRGKSNASAGGDTVDVTNDMSSNIKSTAIQAIQAIGLKHGGVDIIINKECKDKECVVLEVNAYAQLGHMFPIKGTPRDIAAALIDFYFPETKSNGSKSVLYLNMDSILKPLRDKTAFQIKVVPAPIGKGSQKRYTIHGKVQGVGFRKWIKRKALKFNLNGFCRNLANGCIEVIVTGEKEDSLNAFKRACESGPKKAKVKGINEYAWDKPVKAGFFIDYKKTKKIKLNEEKKEFQVKKSFSEFKDKENQLKRQCKELKMHNKELKKNSKELKNKLENIKQSRTWRYSLPIRRIGKVILNLLP